VTLVLLQVHLWSWRNRIRTRLRRLRQVRYAVPFAVGVAYILLFWQPWNRGRMLGLESNHLLADPEMAGIGQVVAAVLITLYAVVAWLWPRQRPALEFSEAEVAFLFPAPLTRRQVVNYSLLRTQFGLLFAAFILDLISLRHLAPSFLQGLLGLWIAFSTMQMYSFGVSILRSSLRRHGRSGLRRAWPALLLLAVVGVAVALWWWRWLRPPTPAEHDGGKAVALYLVAMADAGPMRYLLWPARALARPALEAGGPIALLGSLVPALAMLAASYVWVIRSDFAFEEASAERAARRAARRADRHRRRPRYERVREAARRPPFPLATAGRPEIALLWKNLIATGRFITVRRALGLAVALPLLASWLAAGRGDLATGIGALAQGFTWLLFLLGPVLVRSDLRTDLAHATVLKGWPLPGWSLVLGEALAPTLLISYAQLLLFGTSVILLAPSFAPAVLDRGLLVASLAILALPLNLLSTLVQALTVLLFPSWMTLGPNRPRGLEAFGQRLLAMAMRLLVLALVFLPTAAILGIVLLLGRPLLGAAAFPVAAAVAVLPAVAEAAALLWFLGHRFERFDPTRELDVAA
jgi:hypothetical protein